MKFKDVSLNDYIEFPDGIKHSVCGIEVSNTGKVKIVVRKYADNIEGQPPLVTLRGRPEEEVRP